MSWKFIFTACPLRCSYLPCASQSVQRAVNGINRYAESWRRHQSLWKTDKGSVLDKFKAKDPSNAAFEEKLSKYSKVTILACAFL